jgi:hypothetical protein
LDLPEDLLTEVRNLAGTRSKTAAVVLSLKDFIDRKKIEQQEKGSPFSPWTAISKTSLA